MGLYSRGAYIRAGLIFGVGLIFGRLFVLLIHGWAYTHEREIQDKLKIDREKDS